MTKITIRLIIPILRICILWPAMSTNFTQNWREHCTDRAVCVANVSADNKWCRKMTENFYENKMSWKELERIRKGTPGNEERMKADDGIILVEKEAVRERWADYFEGLLNVDEARG